MWLAGCTNPTPTAPQETVTGIAYAGPAVLTLRKEIGAKSAPAGSVKHGEKLEVLDSRRRFVKVRSAAGLEGWTDLSLLLSEEQMGDLRALAQRAAKLPSQGSATVYEPLNIHAEPYRTSPSFSQITEGMTVEVLEHRVSPHSPPAEAAPKPAVVRHTGAKPAASKKSKTNALPLPVPPSPPANWVQISRPRASDLPGEAHSAAPGAPPSEDDWALVRTQDGAAGWVLERPLAMRIPDEVAQYAEGHRITAYLELGEVKDKEKQETQHDWLWTTASTGLLPYEFDSFRVFVWSTSRHRYETAYIERNVKGYYPIEAQPTPGQEEKNFSLVIEDKDGQRYKRTYGFSGYRVRLLAKEPYQPAAASSARAPVPSGPSNTPAPGWREKIRVWRRKLLGG